MYVDKQIEFSDSQAVTATAISSNVYDTQSVTKGGTAVAGERSPNAFLDLGTGTDHLYLVVSTAVLATDSGSDATLTISLESADDVGLTTNATVHYQSAAIPFASFANAGSQLVRVQLPTSLYRRYLGVRYTVAAGPLTAGAFDAFLTTTIDANRAYKPGFTVQ